MKIIDAKGLSCPEPVIMLRAAMTSKENSYQMFVDNQTSLENASRHAEHQGYHVTFEEKNGDFILSIVK